MSRAPHYHRLVEEARRAIALLPRPHGPWVPETGADHDVVVVGAGQSGLSIGFALRRAAIHRVLLIDAGPKGRTNWTHTARMRTLRTPKTITGLEQGIPELSFEHFFDGLHGAGSFAGLGKIPTSDWSDYVDWFRDVIDLPIAWGTRLVSVRPEAADGPLILTLESAGTTREVRARKLVLATGMGGLGRPWAPKNVEVLPRDLWAHSHEDIDFAALAGRRIGVLGSASGAFDNAATALERGAAEAHLFCRHPALAIQQVDSPLTLITELPITEHFQDLPDATRWRLIATGRARGIVPVESVRRAEALPGFRLRLAESWDALRPAPPAEGGGVIVTTRKGEERFDFLIAATGYSVAVEDRPELAALAPYVARWSDRYQPDAGLADRGKAAYPYLGPGFEFTERQSGTAPWLRHVHLFAYPAILNHGYHVGDISSMGNCVPRLVSALARDFFASGQAQLLRAFERPAPLSHPASPALSGPALLSATGSDR